MKMFCASIYAKKVTRHENLHETIIVTEHMPLPIIANSEEEAIGFAYKRAKRKWPIDEEWSSHSVVVVEFYETLPQSDRAE